MQAVKVEKKIVSLPLDKVRLDGGTQPRASMSDDLTAEYGDALHAGGIFPPVVVFWDGRRYWLADGFHRHAAHEHEGIRHILCEVIDGTVRDAVLYSVGANSRHGLRRKDEDIRHAVETLLHDDEWSKWNDTAIAKAAGVHRHTVAKYRAELSCPRHQDARLAERNGTVYPMETGGIGGAYRMVSTPAGEVSENIMLALRDLPRDQQLAIIQAAEAGAIPELVEEAMARPARMKTVDGKMKRCPMCRGRGKVARTPRGG